jgi:S1-C subfamily serine protease
MEQRRKGVKKLWIPLLAMILAGCSKQQPVVENDNLRAERLVAETLPSTVSVQAVRGDPSREAEQDSSAYGAGIVVRADGYIATNAHVIEGASRIKVTLHDGRVFDGKVTGLDSVGDIALVQIPVAGLHPIPWGDSDNTAVGDTVFVFGSPFGLNDSVSRGIISSKRRLPLVGAYPDVIQTDASINLGNSGGAMVDSHGRFIGMSEAMDSLDSSRSGVGFAIPGNRVKSTVETLIHGGKVEHPYMGMLVAREVDPPVLHLLGLPPATPGVLVAGVYRGSPAEKADLQSGDMVVSLDGLPVRTREDILSVLASDSPGQPLVVHYMRGGKEATATLILQPLPSYHPVPLDISPVVISNLFGGNGVFLNTQMRAVNAQDFPHANPLPKDGGGVVLVDVPKGSPAAETGFKTDDVLVEIITASGKTPATMEVCENLGIKNEDEVILVYRGDKGIFLYFPAARTDPVGK